MPSLRSCALEVDIRIKHKVKVAHRCYVSNIKQLQLKRDENIASEWEEERALGNSLPLSRA